MIEAFLAALGPHGALGMPSMSDDDRPFDPRKTDCRGMGLVADTFWRLPGVLRSDSPHTFAAFGPRAAEITSPHLVDAPHGLDSPVGLIYELHGHVLLLGVLLPELQSHGPMVGGRGAFSVDQIFELIALV